MAPLASEAWKLPNRICPPQTLHKPLLGCTSKFPVEVVIPTAKILSPHLFLKSCLRTIFGLNLLAKSVILKRKLWEWVW